MNPSIFFIAKFGSRMISKQFQIICLRTLIATTHTQTNKEFGRKDAMRRSLAKNQFNSFNSYSATGSLKRIVSTQDSSAQTMKPLQTEDGMSPHKLNDSFLNEYKLLMVWCGSMVLKFLLCNCFLIIDLSGRNEILTPSYSNDWQQIMELILKS